MQINRDYEPEISLKGLVFHVLYHWRSCLIAALALAILLGGYKYTKSDRTAQPSQPAAPAAKSALQLSYEDNAREYENLLQSYADYRANSVVMQADPNQLWVATASWCVQAEQAAAAADDPADAVVYAYAAAPYDDLDETALREIFGTADIRYIEEIVQVETDPAANGFTLRVTGLNEEMATRGLAYFEERVTRFSRSLGQQVAPHALIALPTHVSAISDEELEIRRVKMATNVDAFVAGRNNAAGNAAAAGASAGGSAVKSAVKYAVLGCLLGGFAAVLIYALQYMLSGKLKEAREMNEALGLPVFGDYIHSRARRPGKGMDGLIERWENGAAAVGDETVNAGICALIREKGAGKTVLLTGTVGQKKLQQLRDMAAASVQDANITLQADFLRGEGAVAASAQADVVILVEEKYQSSMKDIRREAEMLSINQAAVAGCILL